MFRVKEACACPRMSDKDFASAPLARNASSRRFCVSARYIKPAPLQPVRAVPHLLAGVFNLFLQFAEVRGMEAAPVQFAHVIPSATHNTLRFGQ